MALRLEASLGVCHGGRADPWIAQQAAYDLWQARKSSKPKVRLVKLAHRVCKSNRTRTRRLR
jgi:plasmid maintenance system antidote protein VapI